MSIGIVGSFYFYAYFSPAYSLLLLLSSVVDYVAGKAMAQIPEAENRRRKKWLWFSLGVNLGMLALFKYAAFFWNSLAWTMAWEPMEASLPPMGISFFTFQTLSYSIDIYRGQLRPAKTFREFLFFISFFPQLVAGPIVRARDFLPQIQQAGLRMNDWRWVFWKFARGFFKKACLADALGVVMVDSVHADIASASPTMVWLAVLAYGLQIYLDFSGYSDMAIACGRLLGFHFPENFNHPYLATSFSEFWKRWHISLSSWLRDYLYISLGGSRGSQWSTQFNLMITMLLGGLWHGASWNFVLWGGLSGTYLLLEHIVGWRGVSEKAGDSGAPLSNHLKVILGRVWVVGGFFFSMIFFRSTDLQTSWIVIHKLCQITLTDFWTWMSSLGGDQWIQMPLLLVLSASTHVMAAWPNLRARFQKTPVELRFLIWTSLGFWLLHFFPTGKTSPFIYFQF